LCIYEQLYVKLAVVILGYFMSLFEQSERWHYCCSTLP